MKKLIAAILTSAMLMTPTMALAEPNGPQGMSPQRQQTRQEAPRGETGAALYVLTEMFSSGCVANPVENISVRT